MPNDDIPLIKKCAIYTSNVAIGFMILSGCLVWMYRDTQRFKKEERLRKSRGRRPL